jgi:16S rRNA (cytosine1402-N4)-methyltransferase
VHIPVLVSEVLRFLDGSNHNNIIDATFGCGGHAKAILELCNECSVLGIDRDEAAVEYAKSVAVRYRNRFEFLNIKFSQIPEFVPRDKKYDAILFDFGVSSMQIDNPARGFSFSRKGILDMRMSKNTSESALDVVNFYSFDDLADIIYYYGNESKARKIAVNIISRRKKEKITTTTQLKSAIDEVFDGITKTKIDNATKTFQALRIFVNDELREIAQALKMLPRILRPNARIVTISFHSLEDRIVKLWQKDNSDQFSCINQNVVRPSLKEIERNARSRSAVLRAFVFQPSNGATGDFTCHE